MAQTTAQQDMAVLVRSNEILERIIDHLLSDEYTPEMLLNFQEELGRSIRATSKIKEKYNI